MQEVDLIQTALDNLKEVVPLKAKWLRGSPRTDGKISMEINGQKLVLDAEVKLEVKPSMIPVLLQQTAGLMNPIVVANAISSKAKEILRAERIAYLEGNGNIYLQADGTYLFIDTQQSRRLPTASSKLTFTEADTRLLYYLLQYEALGHQTYREIAKRTDTPLGGISALFKKLESSSFLIKGRGGNQFRNKKDMLQLWVNAYETKLYPKTEIGRFRFADKTKFDSWKDLDLDSDNTWWGEEPAASLLTNYLNPGSLCLYSRIDRLTLMKKYRFAPDPKGNVVLRRPFWPERLDPGAETVSPLLVYADLLATGEHRCIETAQILYETRLAKEF